MWQIAETSGLVSEVSQSRRAGFVGCYCLCCEWMQLEQLLEAAVDVLVASDVDRADQASSVLGLCPLDVLCAQEAVLDSWAVGFRPEMAFEIGALGRIGASCLSVLRSLECLACFSDLEEIRPSAEVELPLQSLLDRAPPASIVAFHSNGG